jgi:hypothetical protein
MTAQPVVHAEFFSGPPMLLLTDLSRRKPHRDLLVPVEEALEAARRENLHNPDTLGECPCCTKRGAPPRPEHVWERDLPLFGEPPLCPGGASYRKVL